ncbi:MAG: ribosome small subunit-dependent GTPase A [Anaerolineales bacterium]|nr:MAG: ribosome small subunit-dependent GTPase A [Anaerolineales bacterium]
MTQSTTLSGLIIKAQSGIFNVDVGDTVISAKLRGRLMQARMESDVAALGDRVQVSLLEDGTGAIEEVEARSRVLSRPAPGRPGVEQVLIANPDQAVFVFACAEPNPNFRMLDRFLVVAEREQIPAIICANKIDLVVPRSAREEFGPYPELGYPVIYTSAVNGKGIRKLSKALQGKITVMAGPSGVGKSSLLNAIQPGLGLRTKGVSDWSGKGQHTTVVPELIPLEMGGYVGDTPGVKSFGIWDIEADELDAYFPEMRDRVADCAFSDCTHEHEPDCAIIAAVERGEIMPERYESYLRIRQEELE